MDAPLTFLIADADEEVRAGVVAAVGQTDPTAQVIEAANGRELEAALASCEVNVVLLDVVLPGMNASNLVAWRASVGPQRMIVLLTDRIAPGWPALAKQIGAYDVLLKPLAGKQIERVIKAIQVIRRKRSLLVVEPRQATRALIRRLLAESHFSFEITEADTGRLALRQAEKNAFDVAIVEMTLSDYPSLELVCRLNDSTPDTKLLLTGFSLDRELARSYEVFGVSGFLRKPFNFADVDKLLYRAFGLWHPYLVTALQAESDALARSLLSPNQQPAPRA